MRVTDSCTVVYAEATASGSGSRRVLATDSQPMRKVSVTLPPRDRVGEDGLPGKGSLLCSLAGGRPVSMPVETDGRGHDP